MPLTDEQIAVLLKPIAPHRVKRTPDGYEHVEAYDIRAMLNRIFGFAGWSLEETTPAVCVIDREHKLSSGKPGVKVAYRAHIVITVLETGARYSGSSVGESTMPDYKHGDAHDMALKTAESGALKRAASNLGDQFGLSLYNDGSMQPLVQRVVGYNTQQDVQDSSERTPSPGRGRPGGTASQPGPVEPPPSPHPGAAPTVKQVMAAFTKLSSELRREAMRLAADEGITTIGSSMSEEQASKVVEIIFALTSNTNTPQKEPQ